jgi:large subunit ribosomal protein L29
MAKPKTTVKELRELDPKELRARAHELEQTLFELRSKHSTGVLDSTADLPKTKREIARILTVAREKELAAGKKE